MIRETPEYISIEFVNYLYILVKIALKLIPAIKNTHSRAFQLRLAISILSNSVVIFNSLFVYSIEIKYINLDIKITKIIPPKHNLTLVAKRNQKPLMINNGRETFIIKDETLY